MRISERTLGSGLALIRRWEKESEKVNIEVLAVVVKASDSPAFLITQVIFKQSYHLSPALLKIRGFKFLVCFLSISLLVPSLYEGYLTADLTRPLPAKKLRTVEEGVEKGFFILARIL